MAARRPLVVASGRRKELPSADTLAIGPTATPAVLDASAMTAQRTFALPNTSGTLALTSDITGGSDVRDAWLFG